MMIRTVCGDIKNEELGMTSVHEHTDMKGIALKKILLLSAPSMILGATGYKGGTDIKEERARRNSLGLEIPMMDIKSVLSAMNQPKNEAAKLKSIDFYANELKEFAAVGGNSICDCSPPIPAVTDIRARQDISKKSGINIIAAAGYYVKASIPKKHIANGLTYMKDYLREYLENGDGSCDGRPGIVKCAVSVVENGRISAAEQMAVDACAAVATEYGLSLHIHTAFPVRKEMILALAAHLLTDIKVNSDKVVFCHMDSYNIGSGNPATVVNEKGYDLELPLLLTDMGFRIGLDTWSISAKDENALQFLLNARIAMLHDLLDRERVEKITLGHDFMARKQAVQNGGKGYTMFPSILKNDFKKAGYGNAYQIMTEINPQKLLSF